jgi:gamma-glutamyltranspeptidase/glutathione hydrolase
MGIITKFPETAKILLREGLPLRISDLLIQNDLSNTLKLIAKEGPDAFYKGRITKTIINELERNGGLLTEKDFAQASKPTLYKPGQGTYRNHDVYFMPRDCGGPTVMEILNILEGYDIKGLGHNTSKLIHLLAEVFNIAYADFHAYVGDPKFTRFPFKGLTSKEYASEVRKRINFEKAIMEFKASDPWIFEDGYTTHLSTVDKKRNMVSWTQTLGSRYGSKVVAKGTGVILNNQMLGFNPEPGHANSIAPGKTRVGHTSPMLMLMNGLPFLNVGAPGGTKIITCIPQIITNVIDYGMGIQDSMGAPRIDAGSIFGKEEIIVLDSRINEEVMRALIGMGHKINVVEERITSHFARPVGILIDHKTDTLHGGVDPFRPGLALGF